MSKLKHRLNEDRAIRDAARSVLSAQVAVIRQGVSGEKIGADLADRLTEPANKKLEGAGLPAKVIAAAMAGAASVVGIALAWKPVTELLQSAVDESAEESVDVE